jgi:serine/threonine protein phosphatase PrpC
MGTYLSTPVTEKCQESGDHLECSVVPLTWGVVDMQGWRKSMEDAHVAQTDIEYPEDESNAKIFAVFDGHGGSEVARFCQLYLVSVLTQQTTWRNDNKASMEESANPAQSPVGEALIKSFHALDRMIDDPARRCVQRSLTFICLLW